MSKTMPTTRVIKGAKPPAMREEMTAGMTITDTSLRESWENNNRSEGLGGLYSGAVGSGVAERSCLGNSGRHFSNDDLTVLESLL